MNAMTALAPDTMSLALRDTVLSPRFYTTDFKALDRVDVGAGAAGMGCADGRDGERPKPQSFQVAAEPFINRLENLPEDLRKEFVDFLVSSLTSANFPAACFMPKSPSGRKTLTSWRCSSFWRATNPAIPAFINETLKDYGIGVDLGFLTKTKKYTFFKPKFIFYAVYLSEKIGYARYIAIYRQLERHPELRFHPLFNWFKNWCNDEFRHGEAFALLMRSDPELLEGANKLWINFFLLSVYATMYVRDHTRPAFHAALGLDPTAYDYQVFRICSEISKQVFPLTLDTDHPKFRMRMERMRRLSDAMAAQKARGGLLSLVRRALLLGRRWRATFLRLYMMPAQTNALPGTVRLAPAW